jgi:hypothetical protein
MATTATIVELKNGYTFVNFFNSKEVYSRKGFDTKIKALNYVKKYNIIIVDFIPENIDCESILLK